MCDFVDARGGMEAQSVLLADTAGVHRNRLARALAEAGWEVWLSEDLGSTLHVIETRQPKLIVTALWLADGTWRDVAERVNRKRSRVIIATEFISVATTITAIKQGVDNVLIKPINVDQLALALTGAAHDALPGSLKHPSLDRTIYEILSQAVESAGSIAGAARLLRIDRRSLRRMLQKTPPAL